MKGEWVKAMFKKRGGFRQRALDMIDREGMDSFIEQVDKYKHEGIVIKNARCSECNAIIKEAVTREDGKVVCSKCWEPQPPSVGNSYGSFWDDESGASSSWDMTVKLYEKGTQ